MILETFTITINGDLTDEIKSVIKNKTTNLDFSKVVKVCVKFMSGLDFLLYELNDILKEISKNMKYNIKPEMFVIVDKEYHSGQKMVEVITTNNDDDWKNHPFLSFKEAI